MQCRNTRSSTLRCRSCRFYASINTAADKTRAGRSHLARLFSGNRKNCTRLCRDTLATPSTPAPKSDRSVTVSWKRFKLRWLIRQQESSLRYTYREQTTLMNSQRRGCVSNSRDWGRLINSPSIRLPRNTLRKIKKKKTILKTLYILI